MRNISLVAKMQVFRRDYPMFAFSYDKSRCVTRIWNTIEMWCDTPNKYTALLQCADANELSSLTYVRTNARNPNSRSYGFPYEPFLHSRSPRKRKRTISTFHD